MTSEEKQKAIDALKISAPIMAVTQEEFTDYIQTLNKIMDWLEQEPKTGHWIEDNQRDLRICSICGRALPLIPRKDYYCPNCGAKMESEEKYEQDNIRN